MKRYAFDSDHYYDEFITGTRKFGGGLFTLSMQDGSVAEVAAALRDGIVDRYDLSFDGRRIVFDYKPPRPEGFRVYEVGVDGTGLRQITFPPADENQRMATYCTWSPNQLQENPWRYGHWTDDMHPCYLADGGIAFTSTRGEQSVLCGGHSLTVPNLHRVEADGSGLRRLSRGALSEFCPTLLSDGRIMYNRWEYVDKGAAAVQSLWAMYPDGGRPEEIYGNNIGTPGVFSQAKQVPGRDHLVVCLGTSHAPGNIGAILLIDRHQNKRSDAAMQVLTPGCVPKGNWGLRQFRNGRWLMDIYGPWYCDPFPLADPGGGSADGKFFLVSCNPEGMWNDPAGYGIYLLDVFGNRVPIYRDPETSCWQARPLGAQADDRSTLAGLSDSADATDVRVGRVPRTRRMSRGHGEVPARHGASAATLVGVPGLRTHRLGARPDGGGELVHALERQGAARGGPGPGGRVGAIHGACRTRHLPAGAGRGLHGGSADADVRELAARRAAFVHRLSRAPQSSRRRITGHSRFACRLSRLNRSRASRRPGRSTMPPMSSRSSTGTASVATTRRNRTPRST